jgi:hypothetical protein
VIGVIHKDRETPPGPLFEVKKIHALSLACRSDERGPKDRTAGRGARISSGARSCTLVNKPLPLGAKQSGGARYRATSRRVPAPSDR